MCALLFVKMGPKGDIIKISPFHIFFKDANRPMRNQKRKWTKSNSYKLHTITTSSATAPRYLLFFICRPNRIILQTFFKHCVCVPFCNQTPSSKLSTKSPTVLESSSSLMFLLCYYKSQNGRNRRSPFTTIIPSLITSTRTEVLL